MKLLPSVRSSALQRPASRTRFHIPSALSLSQLSSSPRTSPTSSPPRRQHFSTQTNLQHNSPKKPPVVTVTREEPPLSRHVRLLMRRVPHPVAIITTAAATTTTTTPTPTPTTPNPKPKPIIPRGMTVSSFNTVTLHPKPVISFNVHYPSETLLALQSSTRFLVHLLAPVAGAARLARAFARGNENLELGDFEWEYVHSDSPDDVKNNVSMLPRLRRRRRRKHQQQEEHSNNDEGEEDFGFVLECRYLPDKTVQVYDHMIVLATVEKVLSTNQLQERVSEKRDFCLTYADTRFWEMGEEIR